MNTAHSTPPAHFQAESKPAGAAYSELPAAYTEVDAEGIIRVANDAACRLFEVSAEELIGRCVWEFVPRDEAQRDRMEFLRDLHSERELAPIRRLLYTARGGYRTHELHRRVLRDGDGTPVGISSVTFDVSEAETAHRETKQARMWLESAMAGISQAVVVTDALGFVRYINPAAERLTSWQSSELLGQQFEKGMPILRAVAKNGKPLSFRMTLLEPWHGDVELLTRERKAVAVWLSASPIVDGGTGYTSGVVIVLGSPKPVAAPPASGPL